MNYIKVKNKLINLDLIHEISDGYYRRTPENTFYYIDFWRANEQSRVYFNNEEEKDLYMEKIVEQSNCIDIYELIIDNELIEEEEE
jgi:hypothetical protein